MPELNLNRSKIQPDWIIPFKTTKEDAIKAYFNYVKEHYFAPDEFSIKENADKIKDVYIPVWLCDGKSSGSFEGDRLNSSSWREGDCICTQNIVYHFKRVGSVEFEKVPFYGCDIISKETLASLEPFDSTQCQPFDNSLLSGCQTAECDNLSDDQKREIEQRMDESFRSAIYATIGGTLSNEQTDKNTVITNVSCILLPIWILNIHAQGKLHTIAINGQTGRITGDIPSDNKKIITYATILGVVSSVIAFIIIYLVMKYL